MRGAASAPRVSAPRDATGGHVTAARAPGRCGLRGRGEKTARLPRLWPERWETGQSPRGGQGESQPLWGPNSGRGVMARGVTSRRDAGSTLRSGPERGGGGVRGRYVGGRPWAGAAAAVGAEAGWAVAALTLPGAPTMAAVAGQKTDGLCIAGDRRSPCPGRRPELVTVGVREAEQRPLLRSLFRWGPRRCLWWQVHLLCLRLCCQASTRGPSGLKI